MKSAFLEVVLLVLTALIRKLLDWRTMIGVAALIYACTGGFGIESCRSRGSGSSNHYHYSR